MRLPLIPTSCTDPPCGLCCNGQEALPVGYWLSPLGAADKRQLPAELRAELENKAELFDVIGWPSNGEWCVWYNHATKGCRHYKFRPDVCQEFKLGGADCRRIRAAAH